jgi:hypothetical protein
LISEGKSLEIDGWRISALVEGVDGMLVKIDKLSL